MKSWLEQRKLVGGRRLLYRREPADEREPGPRGHAFIDPRYRLRAVVEQRDER